MADWWRLVVVSLLAILPASAAAQSIHIRSLSIQGLDRYLDVRDSRNEQRNLCEKKGGYLICEEGTAWCRCEPFDSEALKRKELREEKARRAKCHRHGLHRPRAGGGYLPITATTLLELNFWTQRDTWDCLAWRKSERYDDRRSEETKTFAYAYLYDQLASAEKLERNEAIRRIADSSKPHERDALRPFQPSRPGRFVWSAQVIGGAIHLLQQLCLHDDSEACNGQLVIKLGSEALEFLKLIKLALVDGRVSPRVIIPHGCWEQRGGTLRPTCGLVLTN